MDIEHIIAIFKNRMPVESHHNNTERLIFFRKTNKNGERSIANTSTGCFMRGMGWRKHERLSNKRIYLVGIERTKFDFIFSVSDISADSTFYTYTWLCNVDCINLLALE